VSEFEYQRSCEAMGTRFDVILRGDDAQHLEAVAVAVCEEIIRLDGALSRLNPSSEIARLNREAKTKAVRVDREIFALLERCEHGRQRTDGYFDVTAASGGSGIGFDAERCEVRFTNPDAVIDLGAIGKGYALDCGREIAARFGIKSALLQGGTSSVLALGDDDWPVAIRHPLQPDAAPVAQLSLRHRAFSCSAIRHPEQAQSDLVNPLSGERLHGDDVCVVLAATATEAEVYSTAWLAMGKEKAKQCLAHSDLQAGWMDTHFVWLKPV
jgi:thiamine biosynthesis lipoprotein